MIRIRWEVEVEVHALMEGLEGIVALAAYGYLWVQEVENLPEG